jgi:hypothetical protein
MSRIDDFIAAVRDGRVLDGVHAHDDHLRQLVVYMACRDRTIETEEAAALSRVFPDLDQHTLYGRIAMLSEVGINLASLVTSFPPEERPKLLTLAQSVAKVDDRLVSTELGALLDLRNLIED